MTNDDRASDRCAARVDAVLTQRPRLRGPQASGDFFAGLLSDHPLQKADPRRSLDPTSRASLRTSHRTGAQFCRGRGAGPMVRIHFPPAASQQRTALDRPGLHPF